MSSTLLRLGLWTLILVLGLYVIAETYSEAHWVELIPMRMLQQALVVSVILIAAGIVFRLFDKGARVVVKNRCKVCRTPIPSGAMFCREHLRTILSEEDEKTHMTRIRRT
jgi:predicted nucleic acid-binding Zn ribbon protein